MKEITLNSILNRYSILRPSKAFIQLHMKKRGIKVEGMKCGTKDERIFVKIQFELFYV